MWAFIINCQTRIKMRGGLNRIYLHNICAEVQEHCLMFEFRFFGSNPIKVVHGFVSQDLITHRWKGYNPKTFVSEKRNQAPRQKVNIYEWHVLHSCFLKTPTLHPIPVKKKKLEFMLVIIDGNNQCVIFFLYWRNDSSVGRFFVSLVYQCLP